MIDKNDVLQAVKDAFLKESKKHLVIAGNWKMNMTIMEGKKFLLETAGIKSQNTLVIFPPYTALAALSGDFKRQNIHYGPQNFHYKESGAYTGEISVPMIKELECDYALVGHSERRTYYNETDVEINKKVLCGVRCGLNVIICIGENLQERQSGEWKRVIKNQLINDLTEVPKDMLHHVLIAYEPIWAIGTGVSAGVDEIRETHSYIKDILTELLGQKLTLLYGGSVNEKNAMQIAKIEQVDGFLIGGASLKPDQWKSIIEQFN